MRHPISTRHRRLAFALVELPAVSRRERAAFTLVELLVVIGIIAVLISILLPTLSSARKAADKTACLASLREIGNGFAMYAAENKTWWPVTAHYYVANGPSGVTKRDKRYHDFIAKYVMGKQGVSDKTGKKYITDLMNFNGTMGYQGTGGGQYATWGEFGNVEDPVWIGTLRDRKSALWGCPSWNKIGHNGGQYQFGANNGYVMNAFPNAPDDVATGTGTRYGLRMKDVAWIIDPGQTDAGSPYPGSYHRASAWTRPAERALIFDGVHNGGYWTSTAANLNWPYQPDTATPMPKFVHYTLPMDWNRHARKVGPKASEQSINVLFCDGHAVTLSARETYKAIRFK